MQSAVGKLCKEALDFCILPSSTLFSVYQPPPFPFFFFHHKLSSLADTSCLADQVPVGRKTLLRIEKLCHGHAGPRRSGERDCQAITSKAAYYEFLQTQILSLSNKSGALELNVFLVFFSPTVIELGWYLISFTNGKLTLMNSNKMWNSVSMGVGMKRSN